MFADCSEPLHNCMSRVHARGHCTGGFGYIPSRFLSECDDYGVFHAKKATKKHCSNGDIQFEDYNIVNYF